MASTSGTGRTATTRFSAGSPPADHDADARTVPVPLHDELATGTLQDIATQAGAKDFQAFCDWIDRNR